MKIALAIFLGVRIWMAHEQFLSDRGSVYVLYTLQAQHCQISFEVDIVS